MKKKIIITITNDNFVRNYIFSKAFKDVENNFDCYYLVDKNLKVKFKKKKIFYFSLEDSEEKKFKKQHLIQTFLNYNLSKSVRFSINRYLDIKIWWSSDWHY